MTIKLTNNDLRLKPGEVPTPERLAQLFEAIQTNFEQLAQLFPLQGNALANVALLLASTGTKRKVAFGSTTITGTGAVSATKEVAHGLGVKPVVVFAMTSAAQADRHASATPTDATNFFLNVTHTTLSAWSGEATVYWLAIG